MLRGKLLHIPEALHDLDSESCSATELKHLQHRHRGYQRSVPQSPPGAGESEGTRQAIAMDLGRESCTGMAFSFQRRPHKLVLERRLGLKSGGGAQITAPCSWSNFCVRRDFAF